MRKTMMMKMKMGVQLQACVWILLVTLSGLVHSEPQFLERHEGESVQLPCVVSHTGPPVVAMYLRRSWLQSGVVLFMLSKEEPTFPDDQDQGRISVSGDPADLVLNVTLSDLRAGDTDRYFCQFVVDNPSAADTPVPGDTEFFLLVTADPPPVPLDVGRVETCAGGSAVLPCFPPGGGDLAVEGVTLKRQRGRAPVEMLYHSKHHHGDDSGSTSSSSSSSSSSSRFPSQRVQLSSAPGPAGITYNLSLQQLQPEESGLYSCQLLVRGRAHSSSTLGPRTFYVSVQGGQCGCSSYSILLYALSSAVAFLLFLLLIVSVVIYQSKAHRSDRTRPQAPIYEEMAGVKTLARKMAPHHLEEMECSVYRNGSVKTSCLENHYESPISAFSGRK